MTIIVYKLYYAAMYCFINCMYVCVCLCVYDVHCTTYTVRRTVYVTHTYIHTRTVYDVHCTCVYVCVCKLYIYTTLYLYIFQCNLVIIAYLIYLIIYMYFSSII